MTLIIFSGNLAYSEIYKCEDQSKNTSYFSDLGNPPSSCQNHIDFYSQEKTPSAESRMWEKETPDLKILIVGRWEHEGLDVKEPYQILWIINANGTFRGKAKGQVNGKSFFWTYTGNWKIEDDQLISVYTSSSTPEPKPGTKDIDKIIRIDKDTLILESTRDGSLTTYRRD